MLHYRIGISIALAAIILSWAGSANAIIVESWRDPEAGPIEFNKIAVFFISDDQEIRRAAEDELVRQVQPTESVAAYSFIPESESGDLDKIDSRLKREGFDGAVLMRLVNIETRETWVPGRFKPAYYSYKRYNRHVRRLKSDPGYLKTDEVVSVETNIYFLAEDKLIYSAVSEAFNPRSAASLVDDVARAVRKDLKAKGLMD